MQKNVSVQSFVRQVQTGAINKFFLCYFEVFCIVVLNNKFKVLFIHICVSHHKDDHCSNHDTDS